MENSCWQPVLYELPQFINDTDVRFGPFACVKKYFENEKHQKERIERQFEPNELGMTLNNCFVEIILVFASLMTALLALYMTCNYLQKGSRKKSCFKLTCVSARFRMFFYMFLVSLSQAIHYGYRMKLVYRTQLSFLEIQFKSLAMFSTVYFCFKKASKPLEKDQRAKWMRKIIIIFMVGVPLNIIMLININFRVNAIQKVLDIALRESDEDKLS